MDIHVVGATGLIKDIDRFLENIKELEDKNGVIIQVFDAELVYGRDHILSAVLHAIRAMEENRNTANSLNMEILLYASGERQLKYAIPKIGVKERSRGVVLVIISMKRKILRDEVETVISNLGLHLDNSILSGDVETLYRFGLKEEEIKTVPKHKYKDLILERVAMVDVIK